MDAPSRHRRASIAAVAVCIGTVSAHRTSVHCTKRQHRGGGDRQDRSVRTVDCACSHLGAVVDNRMAGVVGLVGVVGRPRGQGCWARSRSCSSCVVISIAVDEDEEGIGCVAVSEQRVSIW